MFLHGFQQSRLRLWAGSVDFVRQHEIRKNRTRVKHEPSYPTIPPARSEPPDNIAGEQDRE